jgi:hypothetical protein
MHQFVQVGDAFLEQVAEAPHPVRQQLERVVLLHELGQHQHAGIRIPGAYPLRRNDALIRE